MNIQIRITIFILAVSLIVPSVGSAVSAPPQIGQARQSQAIDRANSFYDAGLRSLATGDYDKASDDFNRACMIAKEIIGKGGLSDEQLAQMRTLSVKAEHLASQASERTSLLSYTEPATEPVSGPHAPDLSSYVGYDSMQTAQNSTLSDGKLPGVIPEMNERVMKWIEFYARDGGKLFVRWLKSSAQYMDLVQSVLEREGVPSDLAYLVMIESGFNLHARSWARAVGPWQFVLGTARLFDLKVDPWIDERYDPETSTVAAARYLKHLYSLFGSWNLAIAAYNGGEGLVNRALERQNTRDFWSLRLPRQTEEYVPQFMAALHIAKEPDKYCVGVEAPETMPFEDVVVYGPLDLNKISQVCNVSPGSVKLLNPSFKRPKTPARSGGIKVRVPAGTSQQYVSALSDEGIRAECKGSACQDGSPSLAATARLPQDESVDVAARTATTTASPSPPAEEELYLTYRVRKGDNLARISRNFGVSVGDIQEFNDIAHGSVIKPGQKLLIPRDDVKLAEQPTDKHVRKSAKLIHTVRRGETLYQISRSYGVSVSDIAEWNNLTSRRTIRPGQTLVIFPDK